MLRFQPWLADLMVPKASVQPHEENYNNGDTDEIIASLVKNGCYRPVYASKVSGNILAGHHLYAALLELGAEMIPVAWVDVDDATERRILVGDNEIARKSRPDDAQLLDLLEHIRRDQGDLSGTGITEREHENLRNLVEASMRDPLEIHLPGAEQLTHIITCPNCNYEWVRGQGKED